MREMILTNPARIVLDVMGTPQKTATFESMRSPKAARPSEAKPDPSAPKPEPAVAKTPMVVPKPTAPKKPHATRIHDALLIDDYAWLMERDRHEVVLYLMAENAYTYGGHFLLGGCLRQIKIRAGRLHRAG